ncbi:HPr family phosphocarrier protein [Alicyclobacillus mali]|uniref:HPr family phosphocarrier protein n=1 Tax=Alicyclobacillus mali (ex Roth et al. 2021) TaxID=1123961 RepID=A0ABS0F5F3_9BACL|nr:HPr family phosphocarrier protein [Alicyclobacillus mali (ex Roth et al. 2021)]MBF8378535.1 HPr family phosphocarrier protein [Alicyclobacillus mali (ex Roth et al. 2021)]MCL6488657.1 HPr family phosphocarrier protein [Alicyclobacillus mali (ex Roth et al. 2021)]
MFEKETIVRLRGGLFARAAAKFVQEATRFKSEVFVERDGKAANAKSIMGVMSLAIPPGERVVIRASGTDEQAAVQQLTKLVESEELFV